MTDNYIAYNDAPRTKRFVGLSNDLYFSLEEVGKISATDAAKSAMIDEIKRQYAERFADILEAMRESYQARTITPGAAEDAILTILSLSDKVNLAELEAAAGQIQSNQGRTRLDQIAARHGIKTEYITEVTKVIINFDRLVKYAEDVTKDRPPETFSNERDFFDYLSIEKEDAEKFREYVNTPAQEL